MSLLQFTMFLLPFVLGVTHHLGNAEMLSFDKNYIVRYGHDHFSQLDGGTEAQLSLDKASGSGIISKKSYSAGFFQMFIKLPAQSSPGVVSTFYVAYLKNCEGFDSKGLREIYAEEEDPMDLKYFYWENQHVNHDELDFEFLGTDGPPFILQTNIFANDQGVREQRIKLWFDPRKDFHKYGIIWTPIATAFLVDSKPIRVYLNNKGVRYPKGPMVLEGSIWNGDRWASGGRKIDWSKAPFRLHYRGFNIYGCDSADKCQPNTLWWNTSQLWNLTQNEHVKKNYMLYDYCSDKETLFNECQLK